MFKNRNILVNIDLVALEVFMNIRIGNGYDIHRLVKDRQLILGGIDIPHIVGLLGHSDADVLTHAIMDALLGALNLGDIGHYFPPSDPQWENVNSLLLLQQVNELIRDQGWGIGNIDTVIVAEKPKLKPFLKSMQMKLSEVLEIETEKISIKATTNERLGPIGEEQGIAVYAVVLLIS